MNFHFKSKGFYRRGIHVLPDGWQDVINCIGENAQSQVICILCSADFLCHPNRVELLHLHNSLLKRSFRGNIPIHESFCGFIRRIYHCNYIIISIVTLFYLFCCGQNFGCKLQIFLVQLLSALSGKKIPFPSFQNFYGTTEPRHQEIQIYSKTTHSTTRIQNKAISCT